jgi:hypothetical protein
MARKRKRTPEEIARLREFERQSNENLRRLWERIEYRWDRIEEQAAREGRQPPLGRPERPVWADLPTR